MIKLIIALHDFMMLDCQQKLKQSNHALLYTAVKQNYIFLWHNMQ